MLSPNDDFDEYREKQEEIRERRKRRGKKDFDSGIFGFIMLVLLKEGLLSLGELEENTTLMTLQFHLPRNSRERRPRPAELQGVEDACSQLVEQKLLMLNKENKYELTEAGKAEAERNARRLERGADILESQILEPGAAARNNIYAYLFLSIIKLLGGFFSGSVGLIADGADTSVDTASALVVWLSVRSRGEVAGTLTTIALMFATAIILGYDSGIAIFENIKGMALPMASPPPCHCD